MATYLRSIDGRNQPVTMNVPIAASQSIDEGDLIAISSGKGIPAVAASAAIIGIAQQSITTESSVDETDAIPVILADGIVFKIATTGGDLADTALNGSTVYDISDEKTLNVADTTGGMLKVLAYDNVANTAEVVLQRANYALA